MENNSDVLARVFWALADPTRRALLAKLEQQDGATVSELASPFDVQLPAILKHLAVLGEAGLVERTKSGRTVRVTLRAEPMREARDWLNRYERFWARRLDRLQAFAEAKEHNAKRRRK